MRLLASFDRFPQSVSITLEPIAADSLRFDLYLTLNLKPQTQPLLDGQIQWGLKGAHLSLSTDRCSIKPISSQNEEFHLTRIEVSKGYQWRLSFLNPRPVFSGLIERIKLGSIEVEQEPYYLTAQFSALPSDISITETTGLAPHDLNPNQQGILERKLAFFLVKTRFSPYLTQISLGSSGVELDTVLLDLAKQTPESLTELKAQIDRIAETDGDNFLALARQLDLDPLTDLAGANLLAAELSGVSLGGADLYQGNFRGANLTDADLSEAIASYASFKGADLSGALLTNTELGYADFYRASLALGNLSGANLRGANLIEANVSQANLNGAKVTGAKFGKNAGMTEEMRAILLDRGAVFEESLDSPQ